MAVETGWMAAAETRTLDTTKALAEREASMDGKPFMLPRRARCKAVIASPDLVAACPGV
jgi:hypothetical protein